MDSGLQFFTSRIARRFCLLFVLCAFLPSLALVVISYNRVVTQLEEQSYVRLQREAKAYGLSLFDRLLRVEHDLQSLTRDIPPDPREFSALTVRSSEELQPLFHGISVYIHEVGVTPIYQNIESDIYSRFITEELLKRDKSFISTLSEEDGLGRIFMGINGGVIGGTSFTIIGEIRADYLWGVGSQPLLPPMTELLVYDKTGINIMTTLDSAPDSVLDIKKKKKPQHSKVFENSFDGDTYFSSISDLFLESRFQRVGWYIMISQSRADIMASMDDFKALFPIITLLFLLIILYLTVLFIRKGLAPLEQLKDGLKRVGMKEFGTQVKIKSNDEFEDLGNSFNSMSGKLNKQFEALTALGEIERAILSSSNRSYIVATTLQRLKDFFNCDIALHLKESEETEDYVKIYNLEGRRKEDPEIAYHILNDLEKEDLFHNSNHKIINEPDTIPDFLKTIGEGTCINFLSLPLKVQGTITRVLMLGWKQTHNFDSDEIDQARQIANQLAIALDNAILLENIEQLAKGAIEALARTVDAKSQWTSGHSERVATLSARVAKAMHLPDSDIETIMRGGLLHDIGKIGVPLTILDKPGRLSDEEYERIKDHPAIGKKILEPIKAYQDILPVIAEHHEKFDGSGYPNGLKGEEIDLRARILAVVDVYDALVSDRPYRDGWIQEKAKKLITENSGIHFDPQVVSAFLAVIAEK